MNDQTNNGAGSGAGNPQGSQSGGDLHPAFNPVSKPAAPPPEYSRPGIPENPRSRGISPARDFREGQQRQQQAPGASSGEGQGQGQGQGQQSQGDGSGTPQTLEGFTPEQIREAIAHKVESDTRKAALPQDPRGYKTELPADFKPPEGVKFEFNQQDPLLKTARDLAHKRGIDQETFSDMLGLYAATQIGQHQQLAQARTAELAKLGTAAQERINGIDTWLHARAGQSADVMVAQLKNFPVAGMVEMFEGLMRQFSNQGGADYSQSGRQQQETGGKIPGYENMNFVQKRAAQDAQAARGRR
jgi:hypothetical protein